jgi:hypothetical protein
VAFNQIRTICSGCGAADQEFFVCRSCGKSMLEPNFQRLRADATRLRDAYRVIIEALQGVRVQHISSATPQLLKLVDALP